MSLEDLVEAISEKIIMIQFEELYKQLPEIVTFNILYEDLLENILEGGECLETAISALQLIYNERHKNMLVTDQTNTLTFIGLLKSYQEHLQKKGK
jgi:hypothetical protein